MCFSTTASFTSGILLSVIGVASLKKAQMPAEVPFASIPIIFGAQQLAEGFVWLSLSNADFAQFQQPATYLFLLIAQAIWPILIPFAFWKMETDVKRKRALAFLTVLGGVIVAFVLFFLATRTVTSSIAAHHILYDVDIPASMTIWRGIPYFMAIVISPFISTVKNMKWLAWATLAAFLLAKFFFDQYLISVWCFFAAIVSLSVFFIMVNQKSGAKKVPLTS